MVYVITIDNSKYNAPNQYYNVQYGFVVPNSDISATLFYDEPIALKDLLADDYYTSVTIEIIYT